MSTPDILKGKSAPISGADYSPRAIARRYASAFGREGYLFSLLLSTCAIAWSFLFNLYAISFATSHASNPVTDLILTNTPIIDVDGFFVYGTLSLILFIVIICLLHPKRAPFSLSAMALFWVIRGVFVSLTHLGPIETHITSDFGATIQNLFFNGHDYFFSGHTGVPFLFALIYWRETYLRYAFLVLSAYFGVVVLIGHLHYSIDVFGAFFITYTIYSLALYLFPQTRTLFMEDDPIAPAPVDI
jgi:hypothetical protein